jgi:hypothetical protein
MQVEDLERRLGDGDKGEWKIDTAYDDADDDGDDSGCTDRNN